MFSSAFSRAFAGVSVEYIGPVSAQAALVDGAAWAYDAGGLLVDGKRLIGPAGKVFAFTTAESAAKWAEITRTLGQRERAIAIGLPGGAAEVFKAGKRVKLAVIAARLVDRAARIPDEARRAALVAEAGFCLAKWPV